MGFRGSRVQIPPSRFNKQRPRIVLLCVAVSYARSSCYVCATIWPRLPRLSDQPHLNARYSRRSCSGAKKTPKAETKARCKHIATAAPSPVVAPSALAAPDEKGHGRLASWRRRTLIAVGESRIPAPSVARSANGPAAITAAPSVVDRVACGQRRHPPWTRSSTGLPTSVGAAPTPADNIRRGSSSVP